MKTNTRAMPAGESWTCPTLRFYQASMISGTLQALQQWEAATKTDIEAHPHLPPPPLAPRPACTIREGDIHESITVPIGEAKRMERGEGPGADALGKMDWVGGGTTGLQAQLEANEQILRSLNFGFSSTGCGGACAEGEPPASWKERSIDRVSIVGDGGCGRVVTDRDAAASRESETTSIGSRQSAQVESSEAYWKWICCAEPSEEDDAHQPGRTEAYQQLTAASRGLRRDTSVAGRRDREGMVPAFDDETADCAPYRPANVSIVCAPKSRSPRDASSTHTKDRASTPRLLRRKCADQPLSWAPRAQGLSHAERTPSPIGPREVACIAVGSSDPREEGPDGREYYGHDGQEYYGHDDYRNLAVGSSDPWEEGPDGRENYGRGDYRNLAVSEAYQDSPNAQTYYGRTVQPEAWWHGNGHNYDRRWDSHAPPAPSGRITGPCQRSLLTGFRSKKHPEHPVSSPTNSTNRHSTGSSPKACQRQGADGASHLL